MLNHAEAVESSAPRSTRCSPRPRPAATPCSADGSPSPPRCSSRSRCCAATGAGTAPSPSRRPASTARTCRSTRSSPSPATARPSGCHEALFTLGEAPEERYPAARRVAGRRTATRRPSTTSSPPAGPCSTRPGLLPHANAGALDPGRAGAPAGRQPLAGDDDRVAVVAAPRAGGPHHGAPDKTPDRRLATLARRRAGPGSRSPPGSSCGIGETGRGAGRRPVGHPRGAPRARPRAGGDRPELPAQARHGDVARTRRCDRDDYLRAIALARLVLPDDVRVQAPPNLSDDLGRAPRRGRRRLGRRLPRHARPRQPRAARGPRSTASAADHRGGRLRAGAPAHRPPPLRARRRRRGSTPTSASRCWSAPTPRAWPATTSGPPGDDDREPAHARPVRPARARAGGLVGEVLADAVAGPARPTSTGIVALLAARGPRSPAVAEVADELRRQAVGDVVTFVRNRNINYTNVCTFKCRFCAFSKGPLSLNLRGAPYLLDLEEIQRRVRRGRRAGRHRGVPAGRHPPRLRRRLLRRRRPGREGGGARPPHPRLHGARGHRGGPPARRAARATTC